MQVSTAGSPILG